MDPHRRWMTQAVIEELPHSLPELERRAYIEGRTLDAALFSVADSQDIEAVREELRSVAESRDEAEIALADAQEQLEARSCELMGERQRVDQLHRQVAALHAQITAAGLSAVVQPDEAPLDTPVPGLRLISVCLDVDKLLAQPDLLKNADQFMGPDGQRMEPSELRMFLWKEKQQGRHVIPVAGDCGNPCRNTQLNCPGFDHGPNGGCRGRRPVNGGEVQQLLGAKAPA